MSQELLSPITLGEITEETAHQIMYTFVSGVTSDPLAAIKDLLERYLEEAMEFLARRRLAEEEERVRQS